MRGDTGKEGVPMRLRSQLKTILLLQSGLAGLLAAMPAGAQTAPGEQAVEEQETILVTARRRDETMFETPTTLTAVSGLTLFKAGISDIQAIVALTPNAVIQRDPQNFNTYINIRGTRQADINAEPNFGLYRNGIFYGGQRSNLGSLVDIARVELLRGPQAGLYGRDAVGGAVNIVYATPTDDLGGYASARYGRYQRMELQGAFNLPLTSDFAVRATGWLFDQKKGEFYNSTLGVEMDRSRSEGGRLSARVTPTDGLEIIWTAEYDHNKGPSIRTFAPNGVQNSVVGAPIVSDPETPRTVQRDTDGRADNRQYYLSQTVRYDSEIGRFSLLAAYRDYDLSSIEDLDATALAPTLGPGVVKQTFGRDEAVRNGYVEALWTSPGGRALSWTTGVSYFKETFDIAHLLGTSIDLDYLGIPMGVATGYGGQPKAGSKIETEAWSAFAELSYQVTPEFSLTGDLRYTHDTKSLTFAQGLIDTNPATDPVLGMLFASVLPTFTLDTESKFSNWSPSINAKYELSPNANVYATFSTGFRAGGFNTTTTSPTLIPYGQEKATNYELGLKTQWFGGRLAVNVAGFYMKQRDLVLAQDDPAGAMFGFTYLTNIGDAETWGQEVELQARPASWLTAAFSVGHLDAKFTRGNSYGASVVGDPIPYTREWTVNGLVDAAYPLNDVTNLVGTLNWRVETGGVLDRKAPYDDLNKLDLTAGVEYRKIRFVGYVTNLFDERVTEFRFGNGQQSLSAGQTYGVQVSFAF